MGLSITLAGVEIKDYVDELSIDVEDTLAQGAGVMGGSSGRTATAKFRTRLGPVATAVGAGTVVHTPTLVRQGEVIITDATGARIFGGYATKYDDASVAKTVYTNVECVDYWQHLDRIIIQGQVYDGQTDIFVIRDLISKYAPWISLTYLPSNPNYTFGPRNFQNKTLQQALQEVADTTGLLMWIDPYKQMHYVSPFTASTAPFYLSDSPDRVTSFPHKITEYETDDNAIVNRVIFYGGKNLSNEFIQDLSPQANGNNTLFQLAYYPHKCKDGKYHVYINGGDIAVGYDGSTGAGNQLKSQGGTADVLINIDNHTLTFDVAPTQAQQPSIKYRREQPLVVVVTDSNSYNFFGTWLDGSLSDSTVFDTQTAISRCRTLLFEQSFGLTTLKAVYRKAGLQAGQTLKVVNSVKGVNGSFIIQSVVTKPLGAGQFEYEVTAGAWRWDMVDLMSKLTNAATPDDTSQNETSVPVIVEQMSANLKVSATIASHARPMSSYEFETTPTGASTDAYFGMFTF